MKIIKLLIVSLLTTVQVYSQTVDYVEFDYDAAGNRNSRQVIYLKSSVVDEQQTQNETGFQPAADSVEFKGMLGSREVSIFPNPTRDMLTVKVTAGHEQGETSRVVVFTLAGEPVLEQSITGSETRVDLSGRPPGTYILKISSGTNHVSWKVIKE